MSCLLTENNVAYILTSLNRQTNRNLNLTKLSSTHKLNHQPLTPKILLTHNHKVIVEEKKLQLVPKKNNVWTVLTIKSNNINLIILTL